MKYAALILSALALALLVLVTVSIAQRMAMPTRGSLPLQTSLTPITERQLREQAESQTSLDAVRQAIALRTPSLTADALQAQQAAAGSASLRSMSAAGVGTIFAISPEAPLASGTVVRTRQDVRAAAVVAPIALPKVSVVLQGGSEGKAVIDGNLVRVGDAVAGGLVVRSIDLDLVTFSAGKEELQIRMPLERLRVLGAFPAVQAAP